MVCLEPSSVTAIPADLATNRAISREPLVYTDPEKFDPDRFLKDGALNPAVRDPSAFVFGYGRRYVRFLVAVSSNELMIPAGSALDATLQKPLCLS